MGPGGVLFVIDVTTDNRNRSAAEIRKIFDKHGGELGGSGMAVWAFDQKGVIKLPADAATEEKLFEVAVGAGAEDLENDGDQWIITTPRDELDVVRDAVEAAELPIDGSGLEQIPKTPKPIEGGDGETLMSLYEALDDHDDVSNVFTEFDPSDEDVESA